MTQRITIDPITRLEGHGKIEIFLDDAGDVSSAYFQIPELRGFESFCVGRHAEEMANITNRICGVCPEAHHMAAAKAVDAAFGVACLPAAKRIRELIYMAFFVTDHTTHFYCLGGPDFIVGPDAPACERNILGVIRKVGVDIGLQVINCRKRNHELIKRLGGRGVHLCGALPGGWSVALSEEMRRDFLGCAKENIDFARFSLQAFEDIVLKDQAYLDLVLSDLYRHETHSMGTVDVGMAPNFYEGRIRVVDTLGNEVALYDAKDYLSHIAEHVEPWSYLKFPYLKKFGWQGFVDGQDSGIYHATPLARLNVADRMATPLAQAEFERFYDTFGVRGKAANGRNLPVHHRLATHWARLIELLYAAERMQELLEHPDICDPEVRQVVEARAGIGIGSVEAPRGTLTHHYETDERGVLTKVNLIVGTTNNNAPISLSVMKAAKGLIKGGVFSDGILNQVEMAFRLYDPCCSCATHALGKAPLELNLRAADGSLLDQQVRG
ncbi:MAG: NAD-reducing hydrogenase HoxS subunit beta [Candidatus Accumulibacter phosphatis]|uniref:NAD-reducing hydrogenase HoxS subunit beta n=1 Tax=Candidatus Accumulibacter phosphatis TaxID=327160 RepID=A0A080LUE5_9PROT|nr:Ni/Fe hydrogenase subunit alpha [Accumulibacter sp.]KFB71280.1 MAG: NAD-reducing hydrogenase HoxS subunit beta [Candidatus Accumulibacter phosphatis]HRF11044.1 Ni/Fe hydrogenase subunit alpha [Candidatus Accumulibacter phosphatis]